MSKHFLLTNMLYYSVSKLFKCCMAHFKCALGTGFCVDMLPHNNGMFSFGLVIYCPFFRPLTRYRVLETHCVRRPSNKIFFKS